ncbi:MAG: DUF255 domain-containing protein [Methylococcales bacterium]|nr:DUF255 domain-containing protein [Methylococcales bacterium]
MKPLARSLLILPLLLSNGHGMANEPRQIAPHLQKAYHAMPQSYSPRTEHLNSDGSPEFINPLILEASPYLLQHAHNPVFWRSWSEKAFKLAKESNKPIFLSVGYATCHWCHVMERESFENKEIGHYLNQFFVSIKVDRERRPDIDSLYMSATILMNGHGGWPMTVIMMPNGKPFYTATYLSPDKLLQTLKHVIKVWKDDPDRALLIAQEVTEAIAEQEGNQQQAAAFNTRFQQKAIDNILKRQDTLEGGFSEAPKFPNEAFLFSLLDHATRQTDADSLEAAELALLAMAKGGINDQIGGGFHRYSTDNSWLVPHFEKMLYNQAHLSRLYFQAYQFNQDPYFKSTVEETLDYVLREMRHPNGVFYSASDADSEGVEGKYFVWRKKTLSQILPPELAKLAIDLYAVTETGNFESSNILYLPSEPSKYITENQLDPNLFYPQLSQIKAHLYKARQPRVAPGIDTKIITAWNGMMITALSQVGYGLSRDDYVKAAINAAETIWQQHYNNSTLWRASLDGKTAVTAKQEDYAYLAQGYLALYDATLDKLWLRRSEQLTQEMINLFWDAKQYGFFMGSAEPGTPMIHRPKDWLDGAQPSGNGIALQVLVALYHRTGLHNYQVKADEMLSSIAQSVAQNPSAYGTILLAASQLNNGEIGNVQYAANGHLRIQTETIVKDNNAVTLRLTLKHDSGWHSNSHKPLDKALIATQINLVANNPFAENWHIQQQNYPHGEHVSLTFSEQPLSVYQGTTHIEILLTPKDVNNTTNRLIPLSLTFQNCSDELCLPPETVTLQHFLSN